MYTKVESNLNQLKVLNIPVHLYMYIETHGQFTDLLRVEKKWKNTETKWRTNNIQFKTYL